MGAQIPAWAYVGSTPTTTLATPIPRKETSSTRLRPYVSPKWPPMMPPSGRASQPMARAIEDQLDELCREVRDLRDREEIRTVLDSYAFLLDTARWRDIPDAVFTDDAVDHHSPAAGREPRGREELHQFLDDAMGAFTGSHHMMGNSSIEIDGDTAHSRTYATCAHWRTAGPDPLPSDLTLAVAYDDTWRRAPKGWRIHERWVHTFGPHGLLAGERSAELPRLGSVLDGSRDR